MERSEMLKMKGRRLRGLRLPYQTRSPDQLRRLIESLVLRRDDGAATLYFIDEGIKRRIIECSGSSIGVVFAETHVRDEMSGLDLDTILPVIVVDDCRILPRWRRSRFILRLEDVLNCKKCREAREG